MAKITTIALCRNELIGTGGTFSSDVIDMRDIVERGVCTVTINKMATNGASGTTGSSVFTYSGCATRDGTFAIMGTFGTMMHNTGPRARGFVPEVAPFMQIKGVVGTSNPLILTAELNVQ